MSNRKGVDGEMKIKTTDVFDLKHILPLWLAMLKECNGDENPEPDYWKKHMEKCLQFNEYRCYHAVVDGEAVGYIDGLMYYDPVTGTKVAMGQQWYVKPAYRGKIGMLLYLRLLKAGIKAGATAVDLIAYPKMWGYWEKHKMEKTRLVYRKNIGS